MNMLLANLGVNLFSIACAVSAAYLAANDKGSWPWFLLVAFLMSGSFVMRGQPRK